MITLGELLTIIIVGSFGSAIFLLGYSAGLINSLRKDTEKDADFLSKNKVSEH